MKPPAAIIFDLDGTLYSQRALRWLLLPGLLKLAASGEGRTTLRAMKAARRALEVLRYSERPLSLPGDHYRLAASMAGLGQDVLEHCLAGFWTNAPLRFLARCMRPGLIELLTSAREHGIRLAVFSDYPVEAKLTALGVRPYFEIATCASDPEIQAYKPNPRGLRVILERMGVAAGDAVYIGDRPEVDAAAATAAGIPSIIVAGERFAEVGLLLVGMLPSK
jgi:FMN phosphatase YigB (HAD superfamily)